MLPRYTRWIMLWLAGALFLAAADHTAAQQDDLIAQTTFAAVSITEQGITPPELVLPVGVPIVLQIRNLDTAPHCLGAELPASAQLAALRNQPASQPPELACPPLVATGDPGGSGDAPTLPVPDLGEIEQGVQCGPSEVLLDRRVGVWSYALPTPLTGGERGTLCFLVTTPGEYVLRDALNPSIAIPLAVGVPGGGAAVPPAQATATPEFGTPLPGIPTSTPTTPGGLPTTGREGPASPVTFWLLLGAWTFALGALFKRQVA